ncbi:Csu type fimbrial protein [Brucella intermedia]|uniref:Spore coat protein U domain-containing protein n=1 Tax=Brucella intermedia TaxID=94625 RepID=A0A7V6U1M1_9HYPH|nr:spore coat U domain-containing protein [Brucella intermedia]PJR89845.1 U precursor [Ochrobactrum sp. 721/2009]PJT14062.1 U precursor [Ochrobactrum sp. 720/2009]PJT24231.1 U precursor [Ochrobactrum sp. 715/2009]PJT30444.1 U precursor [Ochrobactrum sp. 695/2009]PJT33971.1 U precursor [Ochrobactrum sp. 689/2009]
MYTIKLMSNISCFLILMGLVPAAHAAQIDGKLQVKVNIGSGCELKSGDKSVLDFGSLNDLNDKDHDGQTAASSGIDIQCSKGIAYRIGLDRGINTSATNERQMKNGSSLIKYSLYRDSARTQLWESLKDPVSILSGVGTGVLQSYPVYGRIPKQATPAAGAYSDTVTVEVSF